MTMVPDRNYYSGVKVSCEEMAELERSFGVDHKKMHDAGGGAGRPLRSGDGSPQGVQTLEELGGGQANDADPRSAGGANKARPAGRGDTPGRVQALEQPIGGVAAADDSGESDAERLVRELYGYQTARPGPAGGALGGAAGAAGKAGSNAAGARSPFSGAAQGGAAVAGAHGDNPPSSLTSGGKPAGDTTMGGATGAVGSGSAFTLEQLLGGGGADGVAPKARGASDEELLSLLDRGKRAGGGAATKAGAAGGAQTLERLLSGGAAEGAGGVGASGAEHAGRGKLGGRVETAAATGSGSAQTLEQLLLAGRAPNGGAAAVGSVGDADLLSLLGGAPRAAAGVAAEAATRDSAGGAQTLEQLLGGGPGHRGAIEFDLSLLGAGAAGGAGVAGGTAGDAAPAAVTPGASSAAADGAADLSARARLHARATPIIFDAHCPLAVQQHTRRLRVGHDCQVLAITHRVQVRSCRAVAACFAYCQLTVAKAFLIGAVYIVIAWDTNSLCRRNNRVAHDIVLFVLVANVEWTTLSVPRVTATLLVLRTFEIRQHLIEGPAFVTKL